MTRSEGELSKRTWNYLARRDPMWFIAAEPGKERSWNREAFYARGRADMGWILPAINCAEPQNRTLLELGCGMGRHTLAFAHVFQRVIAVDVSDEMLSLAKSNSQDIDNISWILTDGRNLAAVRDDSVDVVFSYLVLQHLPSPDMIRSYLVEFARVLRPGGIAYFQLPIVPTTVAGASRAAVRRILNAGLRLSVRLIPFFDRRLTVNAPAYRGSRLPLDVMRGALDGGGLVLDEIGDTGRTWAACYQTFVRALKPAPRDG